MFDQCLRVPDVAQTLVWFISYSERICLCIYVFRRPFYIWLTISHRERALSSVSLWNLFDLSDIRNTAAEVATKISTNVRILFLECWNIVPRLFRYAWRYCRMNIFPYRHRLYFKYFNYWVTKPSFGVAWQKYGPSATLLHCNKEPRNVVKQGRVSMIWISLRTFRGTAT